MAWNEPGSPKGQDPWGGRNKQQGSPDLDEIVRRIQKKFRELLGGGKGRGSEGGGASFAGPQGIGAFALVLLGLWLAYDMTYIIQPAERGVVLRFGKYVDTMRPGPSIRWPRPIEYVTRVGVDEIRTVEFGRAARRGSGTGATSEGVMLTEDENIVDIQLAVQYKVKDAHDFVFNVRDPDLTLSEAAKAAVREVVGKSKMDYVLQEGRADIAARTQQIIQVILDRYNTGLAVTTVNLLDAQPPEQVQESFLDVIRAREDRNRLINEAQAYANEVLPKARGEAARITEDANAYKAKVTSESQGDAARFSQILTQYEKAPKVTRQRMYLETVETVLGKSSKVMIDVKQGNSMLYLPLDKLIQQPSADLMPPLAPAAPSSRSVSNDGLGPVQIPMDDRSRQGQRSREVR